MLCDVSSGLPFRDGAFDEVYSSFLFEHLPNPGSAINEMKRVCRPGGEITIITDNAGYLPYYVPVFFGWHVGLYRGGDSRDRHYGVFTLEHLQNHLSDANLEILELRSGPRPERKRSSLPSLILSKIGLLQYVAHPVLYARARKMPTEGSFGGEIT